MQVLGKGGGSCRSALWVEEVALRYKHQLPGMMFAETSPERPTLSTGLSLQSNSLSKGLGRGKEQRREDQLLR